MDTVEKACCVRGYHIYRDVWTATDREVLTCQRESHNPKDRYAVAVKKDEITIGHLPRKVSCVCSLFLRRGGSINCIVTGRRRYSADLPQGGLEIPCKLIFSGKPREIAKIIRLFKY